MVVFDLIGLSVNPGQFEISGREGDTGAGFPPSISPFPLSISFSNT